MSEKLYCEECGAYLSGATTHIFDERVMCADCFHRLTTVCDCCSDRIWCSDAEGGQSHYVMVRAWSIVAAMKIVFISTRSM